MLTRVPGERIELTIKSRTRRNKSLIAELNLSAASKYLSHGYPGSDVMSVGYTAQC